MRELVRKIVILDVFPHPNADRLEIVKYDGWNVVVKKGEFKKGDPAFAFEIDSVLPVVPEFEFLRKGCHIKRGWLPEGEGFRLHTIRLRGQVSQGLVVKDIADDSVIDRVVKYDPPVPACLSGMARGNWPDFLCKTDQERCQNLVSEISEAVDNADMFEVTVKLDGSSCTFALCDGEFYVCSRNVNLKTNQEGNSFVDMARKLGIEEKLRKHGHNIAIQGELMGPGIQGNREGLSELQFFAFDVYDIEDQSYWGSNERMLFIESIGLKHVPVLGIRCLPLGGVAALLAEADGPSLNNPIREGLVFKRDDGAFSFKAISNQFLLQEK